MSDNEHIPLGRANIIGGEIDLLRQVINSGQLSGPGHFTRACEALIKARTGAKGVYLVPSCTAALEMSAILLGIGPGDEVIMPSFTFVSSANAVVLRGATPVFVDVDPVTFDLDPDAVRKAVGPNTRAVFVTDYAGVPADIEALKTAVGSRGIRIVEDAAQAYGARRNSRPAGSSAPLAAFSFHGTKNVIAGEAGALIVNDPDLSADAAILREKGTDRSRFLAGEVDYYTWQSVGSSQIISELTAAFLYAQLGHADAINTERRLLWDRYQAGLSDLAAKGLFDLPAPPPDVEHNAHIFFLVLPDRSARDSLQNALKTHAIAATWHYVPLHSSPGGRKYGRVCGSMDGTMRAADCLLRLPLYQGLGAHQDRVIDAVRDWAEGRGKT